MNSPAPSAAASRRRASPLLKVCAAGAALLATAATAPARAACPRAEPGDPVCEPYVTMLMPTAIGVAWFPRDAGGPFVGGGVEIGFVGWSSNNEHFGPSQGRFYGSAAVLAGGQHRSAVLYRLGGVVSFEGNASRRFAIPHFGAALGGLWETQLRSRPLVDASLGLYIVHTRRFVLDAEGGLVLPLSAVDQLFGPRAQLTASVALW
jgi:hypothetical protein